MLTPDHVLALHRRRKGEGARPRRLAMALRSTVVAVLTVASGCAHENASPIATPATAGPAYPADAKKDPAPGALPEERGRLMEAEWREVVVKTRKQGVEVTAAIKLVAPNIHLFHAAADPPAPGEAGHDKPSTPPAGLIDLASELRKITPLEVDHIDILDGQLAFIDTSRKERPEIWLHDLQLSVENLTTRVHLTEGRPVLLTARGTLARSGTVSIFITADPFEKGLTFSGRASIVGLQTSELYRFIEPATHMQAPRGTIDIFVEFDCRNGALTGGVKPVLKNVEIRPNDKNPWTILKAWATDLAIRIFSDRLQQRNAVATVLPIKGTLTAPDLQLWPAIFGVMRNAFVEGLTSGYAYLPPATAQEKQGVVKQGVDALTGAAPPKAQPTQHPDSAPALSPGSSSATPVKPPTPSTTP
jgi:hypothetical protein